MKRVVVVDAFAMSSQVLVCHRLRQATPHFKLQLGAGKADEEVAWQWMRISDHNTSISGTLHDRRGSLSLTNRMKYRGIKPLSSMMLPNTFCCNYFLYLNEKRFPLCFKNGKERNSSLLLNTTAARVLLPSESVAGWSHGWTKERCSYNFRSIQPTILARELHNNIEKNPPGDAQKKRLCPIPPSGACYEQQCSTRG